MPKKSAGLLVYRRPSSNLEIFLVHPGGPFWAKKDEGAWSIPKGEFEDNEGPLEAALREFTEETGLAITGDPIRLDPLRQPGGKFIYTWAIEADLDAATIISNKFILEWPPKSGRQQEFPEVDRAGWFTTDMAMKKILRGQQGFIIQLQKLLASG